MPPRVTGTMARIAANPRARAIAGARVGAVVAVITALLFVARFPLTRRAEFLLLDARARLHGHPEKVSPDLAIVTVDDATLEWIEAAGFRANPPPRDTVWAPALETFAALNVRAVVIDYAFSDRHELLAVSKDAPFTPQPGSKRQAFVEETRAMGIAACNGGRTVVALFEKEFPSDVNPASLHNQLGRWPAVERWLAHAVLPVQGGARIFPTAPGTTPYLVPPSPTLLAGVRAVGLANRAAVLDDDAAIRRFAPASVLDGLTVPSLSVAGYAVAIEGTAAAVSWNDELPPPPEIRRPLPPMVISEHEAVIGRRHIPLDDDGTAWIRWRGNWESDPALRAKRIPLFKVLEAHDDIALAGHATTAETKALENKIVVVGYTAQGESADLVRSPFNEQPAVYMHVSALDTILTGDFLRSAPRALELLLIALLPILCGAITVGVPSWRRGGLAERRETGTMLVATLLLPGTLLIVAWVAIAFTAYDFGWVIDVFHIGLGLFMSLVLSAGTEYLFIRREKADEEKRREQSDIVVRRSFGTTVAEYILKNRGVLDPKRYEQMTIYFSDIEGFTTISESMHPEEMVEILNEYLSRVTVLLREDHHGEVAQYIGDAVMAYWGAPLPAPDGAVEACLGALEAVTVMDTYAEELVARGKPKFRTRIGINTGPCVAGLIGHADRQSFAALGDTVNTASRFEGANKVYGTTIIMGPDTYEAAKHAVLARELDLVRTKGKKKALHVYEVMARAEELAPKKREIKRRYEGALAKFRAREFAAAKDEFEAIARELGDLASKRLAACAAEFLAHPPPADWDGSNELTEK